MPDTQKVAVIGLGAMGSRMAQNIILAGHELVVYNRSDGPAEKLVRQGAIRANTPADAARQADIVICMVSNNEVSRSVWLAEKTGAVHGLNANTIAIASSTLTPEWSQELASFMAEKGVSFLEAPVVGTRPQAENGELVYLVGGEEKVLEKARPLLEILGSKVIHLGAVGTAMKMKLVINAMLGIQAAMLGEMIAVIGKSMEDPDKTIELLKALPVMSPLMTRLMGKMGPGDYSPNFPIEFVEKDLGYFVSALAGGQQNTSYVEATRKIYAEAMDAGYGNDDITGIIQLFSD
ncbi:MAG: NAD(P)-dependent oxidoreductase [Rhodothermaceae bacterium]|nr:NAD(P)-dependent oxidoreductase [Rhodothermaceae bacterium]